MRRPIVIIGIGELGGVFAKAFLHYGYPVYPVTRTMNINEESENLPNPQLVLVAVAERDFSSVMANIPPQWRDAVGLLQNELLPSNWETHGIKQPTVISVWFEKKRGMDCNVLIPSRVYGPKAELIANSLESINISSRILSSEEDLLYELVRKSVFVFTINIAGLVLNENTTTGILWQEHNELARNIADDVMAVLQSKIGRTLQPNRLIDGMIEGINGDPDHKCKGRSAQDRLYRLTAIADKADLPVPTIRKIFKANLNG